MKKKILSYLMCLAILTGLLPALELTARADAPAVWDGSVSAVLSVADPSAAYNASTNPLAIGSAADLAYLSQQSQGPSTVSYTDSAHSAQSPGSTDSHTASYKMTADILLNDETFTFDSVSGMLTVTDGTHTGYLGTGIFGTSYHKTVDNTAGNSNGTEGKWYTSAALTGEDLTAGSYSGTLHTWTPIKNFSGTFDGGGHSVIGIYINSAIYIAGLFGECNYSNNAYNDSTVIKNLSISGGYINGSGFLGGIAGHLNYGIILNCSNSAFIHDQVSNAGYMAVGGITGASQCDIIGCSNSGMVSNAENGSGSNGGTGGIAGMAAMCIITNCHNTGPVTAVLDVGGIAGNATARGNIINCWNEGTVTGIDQCIGGIAGAMSNSYLINSYNSGAVTGGWVLVGGLIGVLGNAYFATPSMRAVLPDAVYNCYNTGAVTGKSYLNMTPVAISALIGEVQDPDDASIKNNYYLAGCATIGAVVQGALTVTYIYTQKADTDGEENAFTLSSGVGTLSGSKTVAIGSCSASGDLLTLLNNGAKYWSSTHLPGYDPADYYTWKVDAGNVLPAVLDARYVLSPAAVISDGTVSGSAGTAIAYNSGVTFNITLSDVTWSSAGFSSISTWVTNRDGLYAAVTAGAALYGQTITIKLYGTPLAASSAALAVTIPGSYLTSGSDLTVTTNSNAKLSVVAGAPSASTVTINYSAGTISYGSDYEVYSSQTGGTAISSGASVTSYMGTSVYVRAKAVGGNQASSWYEVAIPTKPSAPQASASDYTVKDKGDGIITGVTTAMEYRMGSGNWTACTGTSVTGLAAGMYEVRFKAVAGTSFASPAQTLTISNSSTTLSLSYDTLGGSTALTGGTGYAYNSTVTVSASVPTKAGSTFHSWNTKADGTGTTVAAGGSLTLTEDCTLYALWTDGDHSVDGQITGAGTYPATVTIKYGRKTIAATTTDNSGNYSFSGLPNGIFNIVATDGTNTKTELIEISGADVTDANIALVSKNSILIFKGTQTPDAVVGGLDQVAAAQQDLACTVTMTLEKKDASDPTISTGASAITVSAGSQTVDFYDIKVTKTVSGTDTVLTSLSVVAEIVIPYDFSQKDDVTVYRYHGGTSSAFIPITGRLTSITDSDDGKFFADTSNGAIYIYTSQFSPYGIGYTGTGSYYNPGSSAGPGGSISLSDNGTDTSGGGRTYTITPDDGYAISRVVVDGIDIGPVSSHTFTDGAAHTIRAEFVRILGLPYYLDKNGNEVVIGFSAPVGKTFNYKAPAGVTVLFRENGKSFSDITGHWGKTYIDFVTEREIFYGVGGGLFSPDSPMTRAMFVTVIGRLYERSYSSVTTAGRQTFSDADYDAYYGPYVEWAAANGIVVGNGHGQFEPDRAITRQEMAVLLFRFAEFLKAAGEIGTERLAYPDASGIASWAFDAARYCQSTAIIMGRNGGVFAPTETATRAEVAAILERFIELVV